MIPVVTQRVFGNLRGPAVYGYVFSTFGVSAMLGTLFVKTAQDPIGYHGMLIVCLGFTTISAIITIFYRFELIDFAAVARKNDYEGQKFKKEGRLSQFLDSPRN